MQNKLLGTGDAVLKTKKLIKDKFFLMRYQMIYYKKLFQICDQYS